MAVIAKPCHQRRHAVCNRRDIERLPDNARGSHDDVGCANAQLFCQNRAGFFCYFNAVCIAGIGVAAVANHRLRLAVCDIVFRHGKRRALYQVLRVNRRRIRLYFAVYERKITLGFIFTDTAMYPVCCKAFRSAYAALYLFHNPFFPFSFIKSIPWNAPLQWQYSYTRSPHRSHPCQGYRSKPTAIFSPRFQPP